MLDMRSPLPAGSRITLLSTGSIFEITGAPMGFGGGGIIYPARRMILEQGVLQPDGLCYALKECYPASDSREFIRTETGEIAGRDPVCQESLEKARQRYATEKDRNQAIHVTASRMLPILESTHQISLALPGQEARPVENAVSVMESLENKGRSLSDCLAERRRFQALETCRILQQLLFALREVHRAGYLHLDIQGGNVFLRGALEDQSDMLTLIDFGSARAVEEDGKTEAIHNREIFTSRGFSAPEMLLHNVAVTTFCGQNFGARKMDRVYKSVRTSLLMALTVGGTLLAILASLAQPIFGLFTTDKAVVEIGVYMLLFMIPSYVVYIFVEIFTGALRGVGDVMIPTIITLCGVGLVRLPWLLIMTPIRKELSTVMISYPLAWAATALFMIPYYFYKKKKGFES